MTRTQLMAKVMMTYGDKLTLGEIANIKAALKWYGEDDIIDDQWEEHLIGIVDMYNNL